MTSSPTPSKTQATTPMTAQTAPLPNPIEAGHAYESRIRHDLMACPELEFSSLVVHRIADGVCLEGVVCTHDENVDICQLAKEVAGVNEVLNHLIRQPDSAQPKKG